MIRPGFPIALMPLALSLCVAAPAAAQEAGAAAAAWAVLCTQKPKAGESAPASADAEAPGEAAAREGEAGGACVVRQRLLASENKQQILLVGLLPKPPGAVLRLQLPLGLDLSVPVALDVDGAAFQSVSISTCTPAGCFALSDIGQAGVEALKAGNTLNVKAKGAGGRALSLPVTLRGFSKAFAEAAARGKAS